MAEPSEEISVERVYADGVAMVQLLGPQDRLLRVVEREHPDVDVHVRGNEITLTGDAVAVAVLLIGVGVAGAVVAGVGDAVGVGVRDRRRPRFGLEHVEVHAGGRTPVVRAVGVDRDHRERLGTQGCGYHFIIGNGSESPDGRVEIASRWLNQKAGAHCRDARTPDANDYGIGVCLIGDFDESAPSARQVEAARAMFPRLIGLRDGRILFDAARADISDAMIDALYRDAHAPAPEPAETEEEAALLHPSAGARCF